MSVAEISSSSRQARVPAGGEMPRAAAARVITALELAAVYASILLYIWKWHRRHPLAWIPIFGCIVLTHFLHHDSLRGMGILAGQAWEAARTIVPFALVIYGAVAIWAVSAHRFALPWPRDFAVGRFAIYGVWCCFQQYLMESYFYRRVATVLRSPHASAAVVALMFGGAHVPNLVLISATIVGGFILSEVFARHSNIWPLALAQFAGGLLIAALVPGSITHQMRVGPGYYSWRPGKIIASNADFARLARRLN
jgi:hypothetical protein